MMENEQLITKSSSVVFLRYSMLDHDWANSSEASRIRIPSGLVASVAPWLLYLFSLVEVSAFRSGIGDIPMP